MAARGPGSRACVAALVALAISCPVRADEYDVLLRSPSLEEQRTALTAILRSPERYRTRIQQGLREYPKRLATDAIAANRAVYTAALVRDASFPPILVDMLGDSEVLDECIYACPVVFALAIYAAFASWTPPANLDPKLDTVNDLRAAIRYMPKINLTVRPIEEIVQGPGLERSRRHIEGKSEDELIRLAGPDAPPGFPQGFAAFALQASVVTSANRIPLYLLLFNEGQPDASHEYRGAIYQAIYRAELARVRGR
jgi:hypothetical protein